MVARPLADVKCDGCLRTASKASVAVRYEWPRHTPAQSYVFSELIITLPVARPAST